MVVGNYVLLEVEHISLVVVVACKLVEAADKFEMEIDKFEDGVDIEYSSAVHLKFKVIFIIIHKIQSFDFTHDILI